MKPHEQPAHVRRTRRRRTVVVSFPPPPEPGSDRWWHQLFDGRTPHDPLTTALLSALDELRDTPHVRRGPWHRSRPLNPKPRRRVTRPVPARSCVAETGALQQQNGSDLSFLQAVRLWLHAERLNAEPDVTDAKLREDIACFAFIEGIPIRNAAGKLDEAAVVCAVQQWLEKPPSEPLLLSSETVRGWLGEQPCPRGARRWFRQFADTLSRDDDPCKLPNDGDTKGSLLDEIADYFGYHDAQGRTDVATFVRVVRQWAEQS